MLRQIKKIGKGILCVLLEAQVKRLKQRSDAKIICVAGSVGKTSTKMAVAQLLGASSRVRYQKGNYNDRLTVPLVVFGHKEPGIFNVAAWLNILLKNERQLRREYSYDFIVLELGPDGPGQMKYFAYLQPDLTVVTAIAPEHMEYFKTLDAVAEEELVVVDYSKQTLINIDDTDPKYIAGKDVATYGALERADFRLLTRSNDEQLQGQTLTVTAHNEQMQLHTRLLGQQGAKICLAAVAVAKMLGLSDSDIQKGIGAITPTAGRMQRLSGKQNSLLLDDTYNASPIAVKAALDVLYTTDAPLRIAILGSMNEMGDLSPSLHEEVGEYCQPDKLDLVITIGKEANRYLAPAAQAAGCKVETFDHPRLAGQHALQYLQPGAVVLAKGSQNGVFAEEALVPLLADGQDAVRLVRQSAYWHTVKRSNLPALKQ